MPLLTRTLSTVAAALLLPAVWAVASPTTEQAQPSGRLLLGEEDGGAVQPPLGPASKSGKGRGSAFSPASDSLDSQAAAERSFTTLPNRTVIETAFSDLANDIEYSGVIGGYYRTWRGNGVLAQQGRGTADLRGTVPITPDTRYPVGSNTKVLTSILIFQLQEKGILKITDNIADHLDERDFAAWGLPNMKKFCFSLRQTPNVCEVITIEQLMGMASGLTETDLVTLMMFSALVTIPDSLGFIIPHLVLFAKPGTVYNYCNTNFILLGYLIEKYTGKELGAAMASQIFEPLGMKDTYYDRVDGLLTYDSRRAESGFRYWRSDVNGKLLSQLGQGKCQNDLSLGFLQGTGGVISTLTDQAKLWFCLFDMSFDDATNNFQCPLGNTILSLASRKKIITPLITTTRVDPTWGDSYYAMGIFVFNKTGPYSAEKPFPDAVYYTGSLLCGNAGNLMSYDDRAAGRPFLMTQAFESNRVLHSTNPNIISETQTNNRQFSQLNLMAARMDSGYAASALVRQLMAMVMARMS